MRGQASALLRSLAGCVAAGVVVGLLVAGLGSRVVMRVLALADADARGTVTEAGNRVGEITAGGTLALILFVGIPAGVAAGLIVFLVRRWLPSRLVWRGLALSLALLALLAGTVIDADNIDFRLLEPSGLAVALFGVLFFLAGYVLAVLADRWAPGAPPIFYRRGVTVVGAIVLAVVVGLGLADLGREIAEIV